MEENKKLNQIDSNNNSLNPQSNKSSVVSIDKKFLNQAHLPFAGASAPAATSSSTVSSVSISSINELNNKCQQQQQQQQKYKNFNEKENHFMTSNDIDVNFDKKIGNKPVKYGELVVLGYNGCIAQPSREDLILQKTSNICSKRRKSKFVLQSKEKASGVKPASQFNYHNKQDFNDFILKNNETHSVTYTLSRTHQVVVQYIHDESTDMFQIGRSTESAIDFIVLDTQVPQINGSRQADAMAKTAPAFDNNENSSNGQSTISRYSCRISVDRKYPYTARIYAAGFDSSKRIFLGEKATKWKNEKGEFDGVTTNGVLIMHPSDGFSYQHDNTEKKSASEWMEVSVCGAVFNLDENRLTPCLNKSSSNSSNKDPKNKKSNVLRDGTLIDLCGATLVWRSIDSLERTPTKQYLEMNLDYLNRLRPQCPVGFKTLVFPSSASPSSSSQQASCFLTSSLFVNNLNKKANSTSNSNSNEILSKFKLNNQNLLVKTNNNKYNDRIPMVYLKCGHVHGQHDWGVKKDNERECPLCRKIGPYVQLLIGIEPSLYCDTNIRASNNSYNPFKPYAFLPCGHMASETTCRYWSHIKVPQGVTQGLTSLCPFCAVPLCKEQPIVKLILQEGL